MKTHPGTDYASLLAVVEFGAADFTWEIVTSDRRTAAVVAMQRGEARFKTEAEAAEAGMAVLKALVPPSK